MPKSNAGSGTTKARSTSMTSMNGFASALSKNIGTTSRPWLRPSERVRLPRSASVLSASLFVLRLRLRSYLLTEIGVNDAVSIRSDGMVVKSDLDSCYTAGF